MVKKSHAPDTDNNTASPFSSTVKDSAQQIWLAGLGAFAKAQEEGGKVFEALVKDGVSIQRKTQAAAEERISEASTRMTDMATELQSKAGSQWGKLENIFEERVAKALGKLGVPSAGTVEALIARVDALEKQLAQQPAARRPASKTAASRQAADSGKTPKTGGKQAQARKTT